MKNILSSIKGKITSTLSSLLSVIGAGSSSAGAVCQTTCSTSSSVLPFLGLSLAATPFAFIEKYQLYIWWFAFSLFTLTLLVSFKRGSVSKFEKGLLFVNAGLLSVGFPYLHSSEASVFVIVGGIVLFVLGVYYILTARKLIIQFNSPYETETK